MSSLTSEELQNLTDAINSRLAEFGDLFQSLTPGLARLVYNAIQDWQRPQVITIKAEPLKLTGTQMSHLAARETAPKGHPVGNTVPIEQNGSANVAGKQKYMPTEAEMIAELHRQSMGGVMPTMAQFDEARPATWSSAAAHLLRLKLSWPQLAELAQLRPRKPGPVATTDSEEAA